MDDDIHDGDALDDNIDDDTNVVIEAEVEGEHIDDIELENTYTLVSLTYKIRNPSTLIRVTF